jgi:hypothetical protein
VYVVDGIAIANGETGISGSRSSPCKNKTFLQAKQGEPKDSRQFHHVHVVNNFNFNFNDLHGTRPMGIACRKKSRDNAEDIKVFSYSEWAANTTTKRLQLCEVVMINGASVS